MIRIAPSASIRDDNTPPIKVDNALTSVLEKRNRHVGWSKRRVSLSDRHLKYARRSASGDDRVVTLESIKSVRGKGREIEIRFFNDSRLDLRAPNEIDAFSWVQRLNYAVYQIKNAAALATLEIETVRPNLSKTLSVKLPSPKAGSSSPPLARAASTSISSGSSSPYGNHPKEYAKLLWEKRTLARRRTESERREEKSDEFSTKNEKNEDGTTSIAKAVRRKLAHTSKFAMESGNKFYEYLSHMVSKLVTPLVRIMSKTIQPSQIPKQLN